MINSENMLETERLLLRHFKLSDAEAMFCNWASDPEVVRYMPYSVCHSLEETKNAINDWFHYHEKNAPDSFEVFAIELKSTSEVIGTIDYVEHDRVTRSAEVGYQLGKTWWGYGYASEALQTLVKYCFEKLKLSRIWADYDSRNINSGKVLEKSGFSYEKATPLKQMDSDELVSRVQYEILAEDYFK